MHAEGTSRWATERRCDRSMMCHYAFPKLSYVWASQVTDDYDIFIYIFLACFPGYIDFRPLYLSRKSMYLLALKKYQCALLVLFEHDK
jgi:hypothetical protein